MARALARLTGYDTTSAMVSQSGSAYIYIIFAGE